MFVRKCFTIAHSNRNTLYNYNNCVIYSFISLVFHVLYFCIAIIIMFPRTQELIMRLFFCDDFDIMFETNYYT